MRDSHAPRGRVGRIHRAWLGIHRAGLGIHLPCTVDGEVRVRVRVRVRGRLRVRVRVGHLLRAVDGDDSQG